MKNILARLQNPSTTSKNGKPENSPDDVEMKLIKIKQIKTHMGDERQRVEATLRAIDEPSKPAKELVLLAVNRLINLGEHGKQLGDALTLYLEYIQLSDDFVISTSMTDAIEKLQQDLISTVGPLVEKNTILKKKVAEQPQCKFTSSLKTALEQSYNEVVKLLRSPELKLLLNENTNGECRQEVLQLAAEFNNYLTLLSRVPQHTLNELIQRRPSAKRQQQQGTSVKKLTTQPSVGAEGSNSQSTISARFMR